jgi:hypothetical protein
MREDEAGPDEANGKTERDPEVEYRVDLVVGAAAPFGHAQRDQAGGRRRDDEQGDPQPAPLMGTEENTKIESQPKSAPMPMPDRHHTPLLHQKFFDSQFGFFIVPSA